MDESITKDELIAAYNKRGLKWRKIMKGIYAEWKPGIVKQIILSGGSEEDAEDVFQEGIVEFITNLISAGVLVIIVWQTLRLTILYFEDHRIHSMHIMIPSGPFAAVITLGCSTLLLLVIRDLLLAIIEAKNLRMKSFHWLMMFGIPIIFIIASIFWVQSSLWDLEKTTIGLIGIIFSFTVLLL